MGIGEIANFAAYTFAPASLVTPLGALSVLVSTVLASKYLQEKLNILGKLGCVLCILGSTIIVIHSPKENEVKSIEIFFQKLQEPPFLVYVFLVILTYTAIYFYFGPLYGHQNVVVYILLCSSVGSLTVMACKGLGLTIKTAFTEDKSQIQNGLTIFLIFSLISCIVIQMNYLNKALDLFNTGVVTPVYYVLFTILVIVSSTILFSEWENLNVNDIIGNVCGFATVVIAMFLFNGFKDFDISLCDVQSNLRNKGKENFFRNSEQLYRNLEERPILSHGTFFGRNSYNK